MIIVVPGDPMAPPCTLVVVLQLGRDPRDPNEPQDIINKCRKEEEGDVKEKLCE